MQGPEWGETMRMPRAGRDVEKGPCVGRDDRKALHGAIRSERPRVERDDGQGPEWGDMK